MGWTNVFQCEKDVFCRRVLQYYWPGAVCYEDVRGFDAKGYRGMVDIVSGGFPCQPFSVAGKRKGTEDDRFLWPEMCRVIREVRPRWVVGENVFGLVNWNRGVVFEQVCAELEAQGYKVWPVVLPAAGVGAPHRRERVWVVAYAGGDGCMGHSGSAEVNKGGVQEGVDKRYGVEGLPGDGAASDADGIERYEGGLYTNGPEKAGRYTGSCGSWDYGRPWKNFPVESPVCDGDDGVPGGLDGIAVSKWRNESIRAAGNAIVPQVVLQIFRVIERMDKMGFT